MSDKKTIRELCSRFSSGNFIPAKDIHEVGEYPVFGGNGLRGFTDRYNFEGDCAIIGRQGAYCGNVKKFSGKGYMTEHAIVAVANDDNNTQFLAYKFEQMDLGRYAGQSAQPGLSVDTLLGVELDVPEKNVQDGIASTLQLLDEKIANNNAICEDLEDMAKLLYDYWFVQFDFPDENGRPYKSSGGKMVWNDTLRQEIPDDWETHDVSDILEIEHVTTSPFENQEQVYEYYSLPAFDESHYPSFEYGAEIASNKSVVPKGALLMSKLNPQFKRLWRPFNLTNNAIASTEFLVLKPKSSATYEYVYSVLNSDAMYKYMVQSTSASTGSRSRIQPEIFAVFSGAFAPEELQEKYSNMVRPMFERVDLLISENQELESLRDFLLPMLMNGQVKVAS